MNDSKTLPVTAVPLPESARLAQLCNLDKSSVIVLCASASFDFPGATETVSIPAGTPIDESFLPHAVSHSIAEYLPWTGHGTEDSILALYNKYDVAAGISWKDDYFPGL